jgi:ferrous iron transport protein B
LTEAAGWPIRIDVNACQQCGGCREGSSPGATAAGATAAGTIVLVGNLNVGKTTLFARLTGGEPESANVAGSTVAVQTARMRGTGWRVLDTPGTYSIFGSHEEELASRDVLLSGEPGERLGVVLVADSKNLRRSVALALQYMEYGLPMMVAVNMMDEAAPRGICIDLRKLAEVLGVPVVGMVAREGRGVAAVAARLCALTSARSRTSHPASVEQLAEVVGKLLGTVQPSPRAVALLLLVGDRAVRNFVVRGFGPGMLAQLEALADEIRRESPADFGVSLTNLYLKRAEHLLQGVLRVEPALTHPFAARLGDWCAQVHTGIPIAVLVLAAMYLFVGSFGATFLVDCLHNDLFQPWVIPWVARVIEPLPSALLRDLVADPSFGVLPTGVFLALGLVMPVMFCFYLAFGVLEDSGYLPRLSILLHRVFRKMGLNGKGVLPIVTGLSCVTAAVLTTRALDHKKERNIAAFLLFLGMPCAPLLAVMLGILDKMPFSATATLAGLIVAVTFGAGMAADKLLGGARAPLLLEVPPLRIPRPWSLLRSAGAKTWYFMKEAVPVFVLASTVVFFFQRLGGLEWLGRALQPITGTLLGLPESCVQIFLKTLVRRESGAAELLALSGQFTHLQLLVCLVVMTFLVPCLNATLALYKERGLRASGAIIGSVVVLAILLGAGFNHTCRLLSVSFE